MLSKMLKIISKCHITNVEVLNRRARGMDLVVEDPDCRRARVPDAHELGLD